MPPGAHPHSRGENGTLDESAHTLTGSSPLTRGKPTLRRSGCFLERLIPTHAGKTATPRRPAHGWGAHPHSRGENAPRSPRSAKPPGSSPLTRGKRRRWWRPLCRGGLIPTHAGKTSRPPRRRQRREAHPHSRGENRLAVIGASIGVGSSPLTRGKRAPAREIEAPEGLIPTHAGKTRPPPRIPRPCQAHPHSRGENTGPPAPRSTQAGSSPLTRGKLHLLDLQLNTPRLIPTHAGKTRASRGVASPSRAHPHSRGENRRPAVR